MAANNPYDYAPNIKKFKKKKTYIIGPSKFISCVHMRTLRKGWMGLLEA